MTVSKPVCANSWLQPNFKGYKYTLMKNIHYAMAVLLFCMPFMSHAQTIIGNRVVCLGASRTVLTISTSGGGWSSGDVSKATINATTGEVTGVAAGTATISYTILPSTVFTAVVTVNAVTLSPIGFSTGSASLCGGSTNATCTVTPTWGNAWSSSNTSIATVNTGGLVTPSSTNTGTVIITYHHGTGNCDVTRELTVNPTPTVSITTPICAATTQTATATPAGGTWASSNTGVGTINATTGVMTGSAGGTTNISYTSSAGCRKLTSVTVANLPSAISGTLNTCEGNSSTLSSTPAGGAWSSVTTSVATIGSSTGVVTGVLAGTSTISYTIGGSCTRTAVTTVNAALPANSGPNNVCMGQTMTLTNATGGGTWSSSNTAKATVNSSTGLVTGINTGTANITYSLGSSCRSISTITVVATPAAITGTTSMCVGGTTTLSHATGGGTWSSSNTARATVGSSSGVVTGASIGTATITYAISASCYTTITVTVNNLITAISGPATVCGGATTTLTCSTSGGTWSSGNTGIAIVGSATGVVTGVASGTATISYIVTGAGCANTREVTVTATAGTISGTTGLCIGGSSTLSSTVSGGTWASSNTSVATIGSSSGTLSGIAAGTAVISYTAPGGCTNSVIVTVSNLPATITGTASVCEGLTTTLSNTVSGGTWSSGNAGVAMVGTSSGTVSGISAGTSLISYITGPGCFVTQTATVLATPGSITGTTSICTGNSTTLSSPTSGGTWSSGNTSVATIGSSTGTVNSIAAGTSSITYALGTGCATTAIVTVNGSPASIGGTMSVCVGSNATLTNSVSGGTWSSSNTGVATIGSSTGTATGASAGTATITYSIGSCIATTTFTVNSTPASITGTTSICAGNSSSLSSATSGGAWSSSNTGVATIGSSTGTVSGVAAGTSSITYTQGTGCFTSTVITVNSSPASIGGTMSVCVGGNSTLTNSVSGGTWSSSNTGVATIGSSTGTATGAGAGTATITYSIGSCIATSTFTVNSTPASITGTTSICAGNSTTLSSTTSGGTWSSSNTGVATIGSSTGTVSGVATGTSSITYTLGTGCTTTTTVSVNTSPAAIGGTMSACVGSNSTLTNSVSGGTWSSSNNGVATIGSSTGTATGVGAGTATITYSIGSCIATTTFTVNSTPASITGTTGICTGNSSTLSSATSGGTWSSSNSGVATIGSSTGTVNGIAAGTSSITYTLGTGCTTTTVVSVNTSPASIGGTLSVCIGGNSTLTNSVSGGTWSSSNTGIAAIGSSTGTVTAVAAGTTTITYSISATCFATTTVTVSSASAPTIYGGINLCYPGTNAYSSSVSGGTWTSSNTSVVTIGSSSGIGVAVALGTATIVYTPPSGCPASANVSVHTSPGAITGTLSVCAGGTTSLSNPTSGGFWVSASPAVATVGSTGIVTGVSSGIATIYYSVPSVCVVSATVTVNAIPSAGTIFGYSLVTVSSSISLMSSTVSGGAWSSSNASIAAVGSTGIVSGMAVGTATIYYIISNSCGVDTATKLITVTDAVLASDSCGSQWQTLYGNRQISKGTFNQDITVDACNVPYVVNSTDHGIEVKKLDGNKFVPVGAILPTGNYPSIAIGPDGTPFVTYRSEADGTGIVKKYNGSTWVTVGSGGFSAGVVESNSIVVDTGGLPYVAYRDHANSDRVTVMKYNGSSWVAIGGAGFAGTSVSYTSLALDGSGIPYVAFMNSDATADVMKFNGSTWDEIGTPGTISADGMVDLSVDSAGTPYIALIYSYQALVRRYNGASWENVGDLGTADPGHASISIRMGGDNLPSVALQGYYWTYGSCCGFGYEALKFNGFSWVKKGDEAFFGGYTFNVSLAVDNNDNPYMAFVDYLNNANVVSLDNNKWIYANGEKYGTAPYGNGSATKLVFSADGTPYLAFTALYDGFGSPGVEKYNGYTWVSATDTGELFPGLVSTAWASSVDIVFSADNTLYAAYTVDAGGIDDRYEVKKLVEHDWVAVGSPLEGDFHDIDIETDSAGVPYIAYYIDGGYTLGIKKLSGGDWVNVWDSGFISTGIYYASLWNPSLGFGADNSVYVGYQTETYSGNRASVVRFDGSHWVPVGPTYCTSDTTLYFEMKMAPDHTPYVIYADASSAYRATVKKYNGSDWVAVGSEGFSPARASYPSIDFDPTGQPVVSFGDALNDGKLMVMKFDGSSWVMVGAGISDTAVIRTSVAVAPDGTPHVAYTHVYPYPASETAHTFSVKKFASPTYIYGSYSICQGTSKQVGVNGGGNWSSSDPAVASVNCSGLITGVSAGTAAITYTVDSCYNTVIVTVNAAPSAGSITGADTVMMGADITLSATVSGGVWSSANTPIATVGSASGIVSGLIFGTATISYSVTSGGCTSTVIHPVIVWTDEAGKHGSGVTGTTGMTTFSIAPNPTSGMLTVKTGTPATMTVYTIDGRSVKEYQVNTGTNTLSLPTDIPAGIYMLRFKGDDGSNKVVRLVYQP